MAADEIVINGIGGRELEDRDVGNDGNESPLIELSQKIKSLELEKAELSRRNGEVEERNTELMLEAERLSGELEDLRVKLEKTKLEVELAEDGRKAMDSIARRAADLETEVSRLQHDLILAMSEAEEANKEVAELRRVVGEKGKRVEGLEIEVEALKNGKAESEMKVRELERKIGVSEVRETEWKSERVRVEMELREKMEEREGVISMYEKKVGVLEADFGKNRMELERVKKDKNAVEDALKESDEKVKTLEQRMMELQRELEVAECVVSALKENAGDAVNGKKEIVVVEGQCFMGLKEQWPLVAVGSAGVIAMAAVMAHVFFVKRQS